MTPNNTMLCGRIGAPELCDLVWICVLGVPNGCRERVLAISRPLGRLISTRELELP